MILDEISEAIREFRERGDPFNCPFEDMPTDRHDWCELMFPEILRPTKEGSCPCDLLGIDYVKSEMRRLFP